MLLLDFSQLLPPNLIEKPKKCAMPVYYKLAIALSYLRHFIPTYFGHDELNVMTLEWNNLLSQNKKDIKNYVNIKH